MATNAAELFDTQVPASLAKNPDTAKTIGAVYLFNISGEGGGTWTVDLKSDPPFCKTGEHGAANCTIDIAHEDFKAMLGNPALGMQLYFQGKLKVKGDPMLATKLQKLFSMT